MKDDVLKMQYHYFTLVARQEGLLVTFLKSCCDCPQPQHCWRFFLRPSCPPFHMFLLFIYQQSTVKQRPQQPVTPPKPAKRKCLVDGYKFSLLLPQFQNACLSAAHTQKQAIDLSSAVLEFISAAFSDKYLLLIYKDLQHRFIILLPETSV